MSGMASTPLDKGAINCASTFGKGAINCASTFDKGAINCASTFGKGAINCASTFGHSTIHKERRCDVMLYFTTLRLISCYDTLIIGETMYDRNQLCGVVNV